jgi:hypothetical protein
MVDEFVTEPLYGNYRAKVVDNNDVYRYGRIRVWIPDLMPLLEDVDYNGLWAKPANNPMGGRNTPANIPPPPRPPRARTDIEGQFAYEEALEEYSKKYGQASEAFYQGSSYIPPVGAWVWIFFEAGNINRPYYFGALDIQNTKVLAENQAGNSPEKKWTILKTYRGRAIVLSDDTDDERVEITGKKRLIADPPSGDEYSVYQIEGNQTTILLDERTGKEKILIKSHKGDFIHFDIDDQDLEIQFSGDIHIKNGGNLYITSAGEMHFLSGKNIHITAKDEINIASGHRMNIESGEEYNRRVNSNSVEQVGGTKITLVAEDMFLQTEGEQHIIAGGDINTDANTDINDNSGLAQQPPDVQIETIIASAADPKGDRDT